MGKVVSDDLSARGELRGCERSQREAEARKKWHVP